MAEWPAGGPACMPRGRGRRTHYHYSDGLMTQVGRAPPALWRRLYLGWGLTQIPDGGFIFSCTESWVSRCASHGRRRHISFFLFCVRWFAALVHIMRCALPRRIMLGPFSWRISPGLNAPQSGGARRAAAHAARPYRARSRQAAQLVARPRPAARLTPRKSPAPTPSSPFLADAPMDGARGCSTTPTGRHKNYALDLAIVALP